MSNEFRIIKRDLSMNQLIEFVALVLVQLLFGSTVVLDNTLIIFMTDHGISHARVKQFLYDEGTHIPFVMRGPGVAKAAVRNDFAQQNDMAAISLAAAGIAIPASMQGRDLVAKDYQPRKFAFGARDRCDETVERLRSVQTDRFLYIRNFYPE